METLYISRKDLESLQGSNPDVNNFIANALKNAPRQDAVFTREDHMLKELSLIRSAMRSPRRVQTYNDYKIPAGPSDPSAQVVAIHVTDRGQPQEPDQAGQTSITVSGPSPSPSEQSRGENNQPLREEQAPRRRPALGPPRRSYSVMDYEPLPHHHRPSSRMTLMDLPGELHMAIFDFLDAIDSTCLGLTNKHFYTIHRRMHGSVPLSARRDGPNELEWAWHVAGAPTRTVPAPVATTPSASEHDHAALSRLRVRGQAYCRKCGVTRCELYKHLKGWIGDGLEYCEVKQRFGPVAPEGARVFCHRSVPSNPRKCGRHHGKGKVVLR